MAKQEVFFGINIDTGQSIRTFGELKKRTKELKNELDGLEVGSKRFKELQGEITQNQATIRRFNRSLRDTKSLATRVGQGMTNAFKRVGGVIAGAFAVNAIIDFTKTAINTIKDFEQQIAIVGAVSGASKQELELLAKSARDLGKSSLFTATEVAQLQEELAKLGFTTQEIIESSGGILDLATAFKLDLAEAAETTASTLNAFGLEAEDTRMVVDVMADSFSSSALNLTRFQEAIKLVAPAAKQTGRTLQETTALLSLLADNGISGSIAGTQLNRVFIELNKKGLSLERAMELVATSTDKLGTATELVGDRGAKALSIFADQSTALEKLREDYADVAGEAEQLALKTGDTLEGSLKRAKSAWDELILSFSGSKGVLRDTVDAFTGFITELTESSAIIDFGESLGLYDDQFVIIDAVEAVQAKTDENLSNRQKTLRTLYKENERFNKNIADLIKNSDEAGLIELQRVLIGQIRQVKKDQERIDEFTSGQSSSFLKLYARLINQAKLAVDQVKEVKSELEIDGTDETKDPFEDRGDIKIDPKDSAIVDFNRRVNKELEDLEIDRIEKADEVRKSELEEYKKDRDRRLRLEQEAADARTNIASGLLNSTIEFLSRDEKARQKNAKIIKAIAIADVLVNLQRQIAYNNLNSASPLFPANLFTGGLAGVTIAQGLNALAIAQSVASIATISSQKFQRGGIISGPSHAEGGVPIMARGGQIEAEGGEAIINKKNTALFSPILSAINSYGGNGDKFERGGIINNGLPNTITPPNTTQTDILSRLDSIEFKPTVSVIEINEAQTRVSEIQNNSTL